jgi:hypothetical protein
MEYLKSVAMSKQTRQFLKSPAHPARQPGQIYRTVRAGKIPLAWIFSQSGK